MVSFVMVDFVIYKGVQKKLILLFYVPTLQNIKSVVFFPNIVVFVKITNSVIQVDFVIYKGVQKKLILLFYKMQY